MHISCIILKVITKSWGGGQYIAGPPNQKVGGTSPPVPMVVAPMPKDDPNCYCHTTQVNAPLLTPARQAGTRLASCSPRVVDFLPNLVGSTPIPPHPPSKTKLPWFSRLLRHSDSEMGLPVFYNASEPTRGTFLKTGRINLSVSLPDHNAACFQCTEQAIQALTCSTKSKHRPLVSRYTVNTCHVKRQHRCQKWISYLKYSQHMTGIKVHHGQMTKYI